MAGQHFVVGTPETFENRMPVDPVEAYEARDLGWKDPPVPRPGDPRPGAEHGRSRDGRKRPELVTNLQLPGFRLLLRK